MEYQFDQLGNLLYVTMIKSRVTPGTFISRKIEWFLFVSIY